MKRMQLIGMTAMLFAMVLFSAEKANAEELLPTEKAVLNMEAPHLANNTNWVRHGSGPGTTLTLQLNEDYFFSFRLTSINNAFLLMIFKDISESFWTFNGVWSEPSTRPIRSLIEWDHCPGISVEPLDWDWPN